MQFKSLKYPQCKQSLHLHLLPDGLFVNCQFASYKQLSRNLYKCTS